MVCDKCGDVQFLRTANDNWVPCECWLKNRFMRSKMGEEFDLALDVSRIAKKDALILGKIEALKFVSNSLIWVNMQDQVDWEASYVYSGDLSSAFLTGERKQGTFLDAYVYQDLLFIYLAMGEAYGKLTGVVVNQVYEVRLAEGLQTYFLAPYGGVKLFGRYPQDESPLGNVLRSMETFNAGEIYDKRN